MWNLYDFFSLLLIAWTGFFSVFIYRIEAYGSDLAVESRLGVREYHLMLTSAVDVQYQTRE